MIWNFDIWQPGWKKYFCLIIFPHRVATWSKKLNIILELWFILKYFKYIPNTKYENTSKYCDGFSKKVFHTFFCVHSDKLLYHLATLVIRLLYRLCQLPKICRLFTAFCHVDCLKVFVFRLIVCFPII